VPEPYPAETAGIPPAEAPPRKSGFDRLQAALEVLAAAGLFSSYLAFLPFHLRGLNEEHLLARVDLLAAMLLLESAVSVLLIALLLKAHAEAWRSLGLHAAVLASNTRLGLAIVPLLFATNTVVSAVVRHFFPELYSDRNPLIESIRSPRDLALFALVAVVAGGFKEELQRAFILERFRTYLGGPWLGLVLWSAAFGAGHYVQGVQGAIAAGLYGVLFGAVYLVRRSLVAPMVAHAVYDVTAILGYWFTRAPAA
jgi:membrane protease YdiL (CAAX protease family)